MTEKGESIANNVSGSKTGGNVGYRAGSKAGSRSDNKADCNADGKIYDKNGSKTDQMAYDTTFNVAHDAAHNTAHDKSNKLYPRTGDRQTIYLKSAITRPAISVGDYTIYNDFKDDPVDFEKNNVLYQYPVNHDRLIIGKFCSVACGARFIFNCANHTLKSLSTYTFPLFFEEWGLEAKNVADAWDNKGDIVVGNDVWIGYEAVILSGVKIGDGAIIGARALITGDVEPYTIVGGIPARPIRKRFPDDVTAKLLELRWWDWPRERIARNIGAIQSGQIDKLV